MLKRRRISTAAKRIGSIKKKIKNTRILFDLFSFDEQIKTPKRVVLGNSRAGEGNPNA